MEFSKSNWELVREEEKKRLRLFGCFFSFLLLIVLFRAFTFQVWKREPWNTLAPQQYQQRVKLKANRGFIYDRNMNIFAMDLPVFSLAADPTQVKDDQEAASSLAKILGGKEKKYLDLLEKNRERSFVWIQKDITKEQKTCFDSLEISGIMTLRERKRVRPHKSLAYQAVGITNVEHRGVGGVEQAADEVLGGEDGWVILQKDGYNRNYSCLDYPAKQPENGYHVVLTLNYLYQAVVEEEMERGVALYKAKRGSAVLVDPFTGEVLAMASVVGPCFREEKIEFGKLMQNQTTQVNYEPGSTFKIVTAAAALEEALFRPNSLIHCENGEYTLSGHTIHDGNRIYTWLTLSQVLENSSNIGIAKVGRKLGKKVLYKYIQNFGFGNRTGIGLPGEAAGILFPVYKWTDFSTATIAFGQGISVTGIQLACMASVIANGGELVKPRILSAIQDHNGKEVRIFPREVIRRVISESTAAQIRDILERVVRDGSGHMAAVEGIGVAGKTGTAQKSVSGFKGYVPGAYVSSFVGFWPAETPMYVLVLILDEPEEMYWGSRSAAPVFARIVERISGLHTLPAVPRDLRDGTRYAKKFVFSNYQEKGGKLGNDDALVREEVSRYHVPRLRGLSLREALKRLAFREIEAKIEGSGVVIEQEPEPGCKVERGMICRLICRERDLVIR